CAQLLLDEETIQGLSFHFCVQEVIRFVRRNGCIRSNRLHYGRYECTMNSSDTDPSFPKISKYPLLTALRERRSRRFGLGMKLPAGPLAFGSRHTARPLTENEEAALVFAACGITGH